MESPYGEVPLQGNPMDCVLSGHCQRETGVVPKVLHGSKFLGKCITCYVMSNVYSLSRNLFIEMSAILFKCLFHMSKVCKHKMHVYFILLLIF